MISHHFCKISPWRSRPFNNFPTPIYFQYSWASLVAQLVKNPPAMWETWVPSLGWEDPLGKGKATRSSILAWTIPWTIQSMESQRLRQDGVTFTFHFVLSGDVYIKSYDLLSSICNVPSMALNIFISYFRRHNFYFSTIWWSSIIVMFFSGKEFRTERG